MNEPKETEESKLELFNTYKDRESNTLTLQSVFDIIEGLDQLGYSQQDVISILKQISGSEYRGTVKSLKISYAVFSQLIYVIQTADHCDCIMTCFCIQDVDQNEQLDEEHFIQFLQMLNIPITERHVKYLKKLTINGRYQKVIVVDFVRNLIQ